MRQLIVEFAQSLFPDTDMIRALEMLSLAVDATIDDVLFSEEDAKEYPSEPEEDAEEYPREYEYRDGIWYPI